MMSSLTDALLWYARRQVVGTDVGRLADHELLDRFVSNRDEEAFAALVARHGPLVLRVCRRVYWADDARGCRRGCGASPTPSSGPTPSCRSGSGSVARGQPPGELGDRDLLLGVAAEDFADDVRPVGSLARALPARASGHAKPPLRS